MALCKRTSDDPLVRELLDRYGINLLVPPRANLEVGELILAEKDGAARRASWTPTFKSEPAPKKLNNGAPKSLSFQTSKEMSVAAGASLTGRLLETLGLKRAKLGAGLSRIGADTMKIQVIAPSKQELGNLDEIIKNLEFADTSRESSNNRQFFIVTDSYKAKGLRLLALSKGKSIANVDASAGDELEASGKLKISADRHGAYEFTSVDEPLVFGISVREIVISDGHAIEDRATKRVLSLRGRKGPDAEHDFINGEDAFIELSD